METTKSARTVVRALERAAHLIGLALERDLAHLDLGQGEIHVLGLLYDGAPESRVGDLHRRCGLRRSTLTGILDRLESRALVARELDRRDRRAFVVSLTPAGRRVASQVSAAVGELEDAIADRVSPRDAEGLRRVLAALDAEAK